MWPKIPAGLRTFLSKYGFWLFAAALLLFFRFGNPSKVVLATGLLNINPEASVGGQPFDFGFRVQAIDGTPLPLESLRGKVVFLNLWATWCGPCRAEMPAIQELYEQTDTSQVVFVMLSVDKAADLYKVKKYVSDNGYTFPVYTRLGAVPEMLRVPSIPTTFVIGRDGSVVMKKVGTTNYNTERFRKFLAKQSASDAR
jgi:thiol-disulfide isomerase/thioredoxin